MKVVKNEDLTPLTYALHLALAEGAKTDYFLTCDDLIVRKADRHEEKLKVKVMNLLTFVAQEVT